MAFPVCAKASVRKKDVRNLLVEDRMNTDNIPRLAASSSNAVSMAFAGRCTYLTTDPLMNIFLTALR